MSFVAGSTNRSPQSKSTCYQVMGFARYIDVDGLSKKLMLQSKIYCPEGYAPIRDGCFKAVPPSKLNEKVLKARYRLFLKATEDESIKSGSLDIHPVPSKKLP